MNRLIIVEGLFHAMYQIQRTEMTEKQQLQTVKCGLELFLSFSRRIDKPCYILLKNSSDSTADITFSRYASSTIGHL